MSMMTILSAIVMFFKNLFHKDTRTEAQKVHDIIDNEICMVTNEVILNKLHAVVDYASSQKDLSVEQIMNILLEFIYANMKKRYTARYESHSVGVLTRYVVSIIDHETRGLKKYTTYRKSNVSAKYIKDKYGIFVLSVDKPKLETKPIDFIPRKVQKRKYSRNCICTG